MNRNVLFASLLLATTGVVRAADAPKAEPPKAEPPKAEPAGATDAPKQDAQRELSGMSILGNQEAPKALVIVPWKSSVLGDTPGISPILDDSRQPVDRDVFMRALTYYEIRSETTHPAPSATASHGRKS